MYTLNTGTVWGKGIWQCLLCWAMASYNYCLFSKNYFSVGISTVYRETFQQLHILAIRCSRVSQDFVPLFSLFTFIFSFGTVSAPQNYKWQNGKQYKGKRNTVQSALVWRMPRDRSTTRKGLLYAGVSGLDTPLCLTYT